METSETLKRTFKINATETEYGLVLSGDNPNMPTPAELLERKKTHPFRLGKCEVEESAEILVAFFNETSNRQWRYFTLEELSDYCKEKGHKSAGAALFGLICGWVDDGGFGALREPWPYIVQLNAKYFAVTSFLLKRLTTDP